MTKETKDVLLKNIPIDKVDVIDKAVEITGEKRMPFIIEASFQKASRILRKEKNK
jgi:uncharacterized protein (DUF1778 family)